MSKGINSYIDVLPEIYEEGIQRIENKIIKLKEKKVKENFIDNYYDSLSLEYCDAAIGEIILNSDVTQSKKYFNLAAKLQKILFQKYEDKSLKVHPSYVGMNSFKRIFMALISDCEELVSSLGQLIGGRPEVEKVNGHPFVNNVGYAVKFIILDEYEKAKEHVDNLKAMESKKDMKLYNGYGLVLRGILERDEQVVHEGLEYMLKCHRKIKDYKDSPEELFSIPVLGLAKLASRQGIAVTIDDPIAPKVMLEKHEMDYPELDFI